MNVAKEVTGSVYDKVSNTEYYFHLKKTNDSLVSENLRLRNLLASNFENPDTSSRVVRDTIPFDTLGHYRKFLWREARSPIILPAHKVTISLFIGAKIRG